MSLVKRFYWDDPGYATTHPTFICCSSLCAPPTQGHSKMCNGTSRRRLADSGMVGFLVSPKIEIASDLVLLPAL